MKWKNKEKITMYRNQKLGTPFSGPKVSNQKFIAKVYVRCFKNNRTSAKV